MHEDEYTTYKLLYNSKKIVSTNRILHGYIQTKNSIMRQEIKQQRIIDNLDAYYQSSKFFSNENEEIEIKSRRRYLENCIELSGKVYKSNGKDKKQQLLFIANLYKENYELYIDRIKKLTEDEKEMEIVNLLIEAYEKMLEHTILLPKYWEQLEKIINKE